MKPWVTSRRTRALYLFAGEHRQADMGAVLQSAILEFNALDHACEYKVIVDEVDILRGGEAHDLRDPRRQEHFLERIAAGDWEIVMAAPPCSAYSRATFTKDGGPKPVRDRQWPEGFPWLDTRSRIHVQEATGLINFALRCTAGGRSHVHGLPRIP